MTFPSLIPSSRTWTPASYSVVPTAAGTGSEAREQTDTELEGPQLRLRFIGVSEADWLALEAHAEEVGIGWQPFALPASCWEGVSSQADYLPAGYGWVLAEPLDVTDYPCGGHDVAVTLTAVPLGAGVAPGADLVIHCSIQQEGVPVFAPGASLTVEVLLAGDGAEPKPAITAPGASLTVTVTLAAGAAGGGPTSSLLLHFNGANNSTSFVDSSPNGLTISKVGTPIISTAQSYFGGASGNFNGSSYLTCPADNGYFDYGAGDFFIGVAVRVANTTGNKSICGIFPQATNPSWRLLVSGDKIVFCYWTTANVYTEVGTTNPAVTANTWHWVVAQRVGNTLNIGCDGTNVATATITGTIRAATSSLQIGRNEDSDVWYMNGYIDELRIVKGDAHSLAVPAAQFPNF